MAFLCEQCPRRCAVWRGEEQPGKGFGICRMGKAPVVARAALHFDEEPCISGVYGSGTVFFSGCALGCVYCQNAPISHDGFGAALGVEQLRAACMRLIEEEAHNINFVNPTHFSHVLMELLSGGMPVPVVWNTGGYECADTLRKLKGMVDIYLPDLKYVASETARRYSGAEDYFHHASKAILEMANQVGDVQLTDEGIMRRGLMIRHLILPGHARESMRVLDWIAANVENAWVSLMAQYLPYGKAVDMPGLNRTITQKEYDAVVDHLFSLGLEDGYVQELSAADARYIPSFDLTGV